jgi:cation transport ATPase
MGRRSRKRSIGETGGVPAGAPSAPTRTRSADARPTRLSSEERNQRLRERLKPLERSERPTALVIAAATAALFAVANVVFWAAGVEVQGEEPALAGVLLFAAIMLVAAWGIWNHRYWAVLGFQSLLAITLVVAALSLMVASNVAAVILCLVVIALGGWLFWSLVRILGRMKVPRPGAAD